jgi:hypothetical protein
MKDITLRFVHSFVVALQDGIISQTALESAKRSATTRRAGSGGRRLPYPVPFEAILGAKEAVLNTQLQARGAL